MFYLDLAIREGSYHIEENDPDPDPYIDILNVDLSAFEELMVLSVSPRIQRFLFDGLAQLINHCLMANIQQIKRLNKNGVIRLSRNIQSLQQNLTHLSSIQDNNLSRVKLFVELAGFSAPVFPSNSRNC